VLRVLLSVNAVITESRTLPSVVLDKEVLPSVILKIVYKEYIYSEFLILCAILHHKKITQIIESD
jgi:hypothetical protein